MVADYSPSTAGGGRDSLCADYVKPAFEKYDLLARVRAAFISEQSSSNHSIIDPFHKWLPIKIILCAYKLAQLASFLGRNQSRTQSMPVRRLGAGHDSGETE